MSKQVTVIVPSFCPDAIVKGYEERCLRQVAQYTPHEFYDLVLQSGGDRSYPHKVNEVGLTTDSDWICVVSNDVFVGPHWLTRLLNVQLNHVDCAVIAPQDALGQPELTRNDHWWACVLMSTALFKHLGGLDESLPNVYHDQDFSIRLKKLGYDTCRTGAVVVEHVNMATRSRVGTGDDADERAEMIRRYGCAELSEYVRMNPCG